ncbi:putative hydrolase of the HAD superfamily [Pustulibacterium marinum]|uniref:Putative hydrolase of the HAD superfamily n=1 Tax=Pustulibacterium marinum TaxID=1224947 RepID=A0A1I7G2E2_9FLAO|nr:HAD family hydrolase [Pustulibacterium marinum]SFU42628.1 putative hydrolase of the HAD superfamily [Pustulibacterium marinum]
MFDEIKVIGFDADDTLWVNETYFRDAEDAFAKLLSAYETPNKIDQELFRKELDNLDIYGYGVKGFMLSMVESALEISNGMVKPEMISEILKIGKDMINKPVEVLEGIPEVLESLSKKYKLIVLTKGDLLDQKRKLKKSNLSHFFHHIEVMTEKKEEDYSEVLNHLEIQPKEFLMIGNSLKSDVLPIINLRSNAVHIPFHTTWEHEKVSPQELENQKYLTLQSASELLTYL